VRISVAPGVEPERAIAKIRQLAGGVSSAIGATSGHAVSQRDDYVRWAIDTEAHLETVLRRDDAQAFFDNPRHRDILLMPLNEYLPGLIYSELRAKARALEDAAAYLQGHLDRMRAAPGYPVVVDSNVLLQCQLLDSVNWQKAVHGQVRVMVPLRVIEEIDAKKYSESKRLRSVARGLLPWIDSRFPTGAPGPIRLTDDATIELILADRPRYRPSDADEEVLDAAHDVLHFAGRVKVLTADTGMRVRARHEGLEVLSVPKEWLRTSGDTASASDEMAPEGHNDTLKTEAHHAEPAA
jgi:rRNA-processing protein FCF1